MNIPIVKMFSLCVCEVFVKVHITNKVVVQNKSGPVCVCFFLSVHSIKRAHDYLLCALLTVKRILYQSMTHFFFSTKFF